MKLITAIFLILAMLGVGQAQIHSPYPPTAISDPQDAAPIGTRLRHLATEALRSNPFINPPLTLPPTWSSGTIYQVGQTALWGGHIYLCTRSGYSGLQGPSGTGPGVIVDNGTLWYYIDDPRTLTNSPLAPTRSDCNGGSPPSCPNVYQFNVANMGAAIEFKGGVLVDSGVGDGTIFLASILLGTANITGQEIITFETDSPTVAIGFNWPQPYRVIIDGAYLDYGCPPGGTGSGRCWRVMDFSHAGGRRIRRFTFEFAGTSALYGVAVDSKSRIWKPHHAEPVRAVMMGDSFTNGGNGFPTGAMGVWPTMVGHMLGWEDCRAAGLGGTGYVNPGTYVNWLGRIQSDVISQAPDIVVFFGSVNDNNQTAAAITTNALACFRKIRLALPSTPIIVVGVPTMGSATARIANENAVFAAAKQVSLTYTVPVSTDVEPWLVGTGNVNAQTGDGNNDVYISGDNLHPVDAGVRFFAVRIANSIRRIIQTLP